MSERNDNVRGSFQHKTTHGFAGQRPYVQDMCWIVLVNQNFWSCVLDTRVFSKTIFQLHHRLVVVEVKIKFKAKRRITSDCYDEVGRTGGGGVQEGV